MSTELALRTKLCSVLLSTDSFSFIGAPLVKSVPVWNVLLSEPRYRMELTRMQRELQLLFPVMFLSICWGRRVWLKDRNLSIGKII